MAQRKAVVVGESPRRGGRLPKWCGHAERMAARLAVGGFLRDPLWCKAFASVPRHLLLAETKMMTIGGRVPEWWLEAVYSDEPADSETGTDARSVVAPSQPPPALLAWLLELLVPVGHTTPGGGPVRVLEIGAGHGYTTALLCHRVGAEQVTATAPQDTEHIGTALAELGLFPGLVSATDPLAASVYGPFDAILCATGGSDRPSQAWLGQLAPGGRIVTAVRDPDERVAALVYERSTFGSRVRSRLVTRPRDGRDGVVSS